MAKLSMHLWFDTQAKQAAERYVSVFPNSRVVHSSVLENTPSGSVDTLTIELAGQTFSMISAGPMFKINPSISFQVACKTAAEVDKLYTSLSQDGVVMMPLGEYPFSKHFAWVQDAFGVSWQLMQTDAPIKQMITPAFMFVGKVCGKAEQAAKLYTSVYKNSAIGDIVRYGKNEAPDVEGTVKQMKFTLEGQEFAAMDSAHDHQFGFNEAVSIMVSCKDQQELDYFYSKLSAVPEAEQCGWVKDPFGVSWQIIPQNLDELLSSENPETSARVMQAMLSMKRMNIEALQKARMGK